MFERLFRWRWLLVTAWAFALALVVGWTLLPLTGSLLGPPLSCAPGLMEVPPLIVAANESLSAWEYALVVVVFWAAFGVSGWALLSPYTSSSIRWRRVVPLPDRALVATAFVLSYGLVGLLATVCQAFGHWEWVWHPYNGHVGTFGDMFDITQVALFWAPLGVGVIAFPPLLRKALGHLDQYRRLWRLLVLIAVGSLCQGIFAMPVHVRGLQQLLYLPTLPAFLEIPAEELLLCSAALGSYPGLFLAACLFIWSSGGLVGLVLRYQRYAAGENVPQCPSCGYDLTGNVSGVCPECGTVVPTAKDAKDAERTGDAVGRAET